MASQKQKLRIGKYSLPTRFQTRLNFIIDQFTRIGPCSYDIFVCVKLYYFTNAYAPEGEPDLLHGEPYHAVLPGNNSIAITHLRDIVDVPIEINGTGISSGSFDFVGNALVFHKTTGEPFTVTYTIDAIVKDLHK